MAKWLEDLKQFYEVGDGLSVNTTYTINKKLMRRLIAIAERKEYDQESDGEEWCSLCGGDKYKGHAYTCYHSDDWEG